MGKPRIGILVVAYNAAGTLARVLDRIPAGFRPRISGILVSDDHSADSTYLVGLGYQQIDPALPLEVVRNQHNLGYGGNQKVGYRWAIERDFDIIVMLHGDGQYAPEKLPEVVAPLERGEADAAFGSRMLEKGAARRGGMPLYKLIGNRVLTALENRMVGTDLSEWHSGYRAYSVAALRELPFERNDDDFNFDTQIIIQLAEAGKRIVEVPIPTFYGDEICYVNGLRYAGLIARDVLRYRAHKLGLGMGELAFASQPYEEKHAPDSSHGRILQWLARRPTGRVLDLGCGGGYLAGELRSAGHHVVGVDAVVTDGAKDRVDVFVQADLDLGLPPQVTGPFDIVIAADVLEHVRRPEVVLDELHRVVDPSGIVVASVPNFAHWYPRLRMLTGRFDYDRRGILDRTHVRFFTRRSFERLLDDHGWRVVRRASTGLPFEVTARGRPDRGATGDSGSTGRIVQRIDSAAVRVRPTLFGYQFLYQLVPDRRRRRR
ncbi:MAG TPA: bifunctional glycosyltransferase/class I SAM-dependent methyltransferase [Acidimicrobiales bacterium]|nr:bifunctional glycosyltransferase/class I SAM-dependent methyltransferase [Acidimicrobiales bacterium]